MIISNIERFTEAATALDAIFSAATKAETQAWTKALNGAIKAHFRRPLPGVTAEMLYGAGSMMLEIMMDPAQRGLLQARGAAFLAAGQSPIDALPCHLVVVLREKAGPDLAEALAAAGLVCHTDARKVHGISCSLWHGRAAPAVIRGLIGAAGQVVPIAAPNDAESSEASAAAAPPRSDDESVEECKGGARSAGASASEGSQRDLPAEPSDDGVEMATGVASPPPEASAPPSGESVDRADIAGVASGATPIDGGDRRGPASQSRDSVGSARGRRFGRRLATPTPDAGQPNDPPRDETIGQGSLNAEPVEEPCPAEIGVANEASVDAAQMTEGQMAECAPAPISASAPDTATCGEPSSALERSDLGEDHLPPFLRDD